MSKNNKYDDRGGRHGSGGRGHGAGSSGSCRGTGGRGRGAGSSGSSRGTGGGRFDRDREREHQHVNSHTQRTFQSASVVYFNDVIHSRKKMLGFTDAKRFIDGAVEIENLEMLSTLTESSESIGLLKRACSLGCDDSKNDCGLNETVMKLLNHLGKCELSVGSAKHCTIQCFKAIYETPGLLQNLLAKLKGGKIEKVSALVWFLVAVCKSDDTARQKPIVSDFLHALSSSGEIEKSPALKALVTVLMPEQLKLEYNSKHSGNTQMELSSLEHVQAFEPQHNNDFPFDYRQIGILPTIEEMNSKYRTCGITSVFSRNDSKNVAAMLDRQFRLLREDMLGPMREELDTEMKLPRDKKKKIFQNPQVVDIDTSPRICFTLLIDVPMSLQGRLKGMKKGERQNFYEEAGRRILARESMLVFLDNKGSDSFVKAVGLVVKREKSEFAANEKCFRVGVSFSKDSLDLVLQQFISSEQVYGKSRKEGATMCFAFGKEVFQASSSYFSYEPILHRLQELDSIPFEEQIVDEIAATVAEENVHTIPPEIQNKLASDPSQLRAAEAAMREKVVLVQGPPGTGNKTLMFELGRLSFNFKLNKFQEKHLLVCK